MILLSSFSFLVSSLDDLNTTLNTATFKYSNLFIEKKKKGKKKVRLPLF